MPSQPVKPESAARRRSWFTSALVIASSLFAAVALFAPRPVKPSRLPPLEIDEDAASQAMAADRELAKHAPDDRWAMDLRALHATIGRRAFESGHDATEARVTYRTVDLRVASVRQDHGDEGLWAMRAQSVVLLDAALDHELPERARQELLGDFEQQLLRYHVRSEDGALRAPKLVVWAMFKARWNTISGLDTTAGLAPVEKQAFEGWLALHATGAPQKARFEAARRFEEAGGKRGAEAVAVWAMQAGQPKVALDALQRAMRADRNVRLRNYAMVLTAR